MEFQIKPSRHSRQVNDDILLNALWRVFDLTRRNFNESWGDNLEILGVLFDGLYLISQFKVTLICRKWKFKMFVQTVSI